MNSTYKQTSDISSKNKPVLVDALYINNSGGVRLLEYLVRILYKRKVNFFLLADSRCAGKFDYCHTKYINASFFRRTLFYTEYSKRYSTVFCFGNIPSPIKMNVPVYTYFHNINLLTLNEAKSKKQLLTMWLKRQVFRICKRNTDCWLVQTTNTATELCRHLKEKEERVKLMPFYELSEELTTLKDYKHSGDYVFVANYTGAKGHEELLEAWKILHKRGIEKTLHLTVKKEIPFCQQIQDAQDLGVKVVNHGFVHFNEVIELYRKSKAIIYPSHNESLGLGIIEAISAGCDVIGADLPYIQAVCDPSGVFNPYSPEAIADAIVKYEIGDSPKSKLKIGNQIDELITLLNSNIETSKG